MTCCDMLWHAMMTILGTSSINQRYCSIRGRCWWRDPEGLMFTTMRDGLKPQEDHFPVEVRAWSRPFECQQRHLVFGICAWRLVNIIKRRARKLLIRLFDNQVASASIALCGLMINWPRCQGAQTRLPSFGYEGSTWFNRWIPAQEPQTWGGCAGGLYCSLV